MGSWIELAIGGVQGIKNFQNEQADKRIALEEQIAKMKLNIETDNIKRENAFNFKNNPVNVEIEAQVGAMRDVWTLQNKMDMGFYDTEGRANAISELSKKINLAKIGNKIMPGTEFTYDEYLINSKLENENFEIMRDQELGVSKSKKIVEKSAELSGELKIRNLPQNSTWGDVKIYDKLVESKGKTIADNRIRGLLDNATKEDRDIHDAMILQKVEFAEHGLDKDEDTLADLSRVKGELSGTEDLAKKLALRNLPETKADGTLYSQGDILRFDETAKLHGQEIAENRARGLSDDSTKRERDLYDEKIELAKEFIKHGLDMDKNTINELNEAKGTAQGIIEFNKTNVGLLETANITLDTKRGEMAPYFSTMKAAGIDIEPSEYNINEITKLAIDMESVKQGRFSIFLDDKKWAIMNLYRAQNNLPPIKPEHRYIIINKKGYYSKSEAEGKRKYDPEYISEELLSQMWQIPDELYATLSDDTKGTLERIIRSAADDLSEQNQMTKFNQNNEKVIDHNFELEWEALGIDFKNLPAWVGRTVEKQFRTKIDYLEPNQAVVTDETNTTAVRNIEITQEDINKVWNPEVEGGILGLDEAVINIVKAYAAEKNLNLVDFKRGDDAGHNINSAMAWSHTESNLNKAKAMSIWSPVLYVPGTLKLQDLVLPDRDLIGRQVIKANAYAEDEAKIRGGLGLNLGVNVLPFDSYLYHKTQIHLLAGALDERALIYDPTRVGQVDQPANRKHKRKLTINPDEYRESLDINKESHKEAVLFGNNALLAGKLLYMTLDETQIGSSMLEGVTRILGFAKTLPTEIGSMIEGWARGGDSGKLTLRNMYQNISGDIQRGWNNYDTETSQMVNNKFDGLNRSLFDNIDVEDEEGIRGAEEKFQKGLADIRTGTDSIEAQVAQQKMLHAALVFYAAAAFQGEGGKAISDGDRLFVSWALSYGVFSNVNMRKSAIAGLLKIIGRVTAINEGLTSDDIRVLWATNNHSTFYGAHTLAIEDYPPNIRELIEGGGSQSEPSILTDYRKNQINASGSEGEFGTLTPGSDTRSGAGGEPFLSTNIDVTDSRDHNPDAFKVDGKDVNSIRMITKDGGAWLFFRDSTPKFILSKLDRLSNADKVQLMNMYPYLKAEIEATMDKTR